MDPQTFMLKQVAINGQVASAVETVADMVKILRQRIDQLQTEVNELKARDNVGNH